MIKFFRHIRKQLVSENKFSKYLLYAIGEIILVVIGILIAIKINAYNTEKDTIRTITNQLENVALELKGNLALIDKSIAKSSAIIESSRSLANAISMNQELISNEQSVLLGATLAPVLNYQPNTVILNEMISTGNIRNINQTDLKLLLLDFGSRFADIENQESLHAEDQKACTDYLLTHGDFKAVMDDTGVTKQYMSLELSKNRLGNNALMSSKEFENKLLIFMASGINLEEDNYKPFKTYLESMINYIELELENYD